MERTYFGHKSGFHGSEFSRLGSPSEMIKRAEMDARDGVSKQLSKDFMKKSECEHLVVDTDGKIETCVGCGNKYLIEGLRQ